MFLVIVGSIAEDISRSSTRFWRRNKLAISTELRKTRCSRASTRPYTTKHMNRRNSAKKLTASFNDSNGNSTNKDKSRYEDISRKLLFSKIDDYIKRSHKTY